MKILCVACPPETEVEEAVYPEHMATVHAGETQVTAMKKVKDVDPSLPSPEFLELAQKLDNPQPESKPQQPIKSPQPVADRKPLELTYRYVGQCENNHPVTTLETDVDGRHFVIAYCIGESKQVESREVANLHVQEKRHAMEQGEENVALQPTVNEQIEKTERPKKKKEVTK